MEKKKVSPEQVCKDLIEFDRNLAISCPCTQSLFTYVMTKYFKIVNDIKPQYHYTDMQLLSYRISTPPDQDTQIWSYRQCYMI